MGARPLHGNHLIRGGTNQPPRGVRKQVTSSSISAPGKDAVAAAVSFPLRLDQEWWPARPAPNQSGLSPSGRCLAEDLRHLRTPPAPSQRVATLRSPCGHRPVLSWLPKDGANRTKVFVRLRIGTKLEVLGPATGFHDRTAWPPQPFW